MAGVLVPLLILAAVAAGILIYRRRHPRNPNDPGEDIPIHPSVHQKGPAFGKLSPGRASEFFILEARLNFGVDVVRYFTGIPAIISQTLGFARQIKPTET